MGPDIPNPQYSQEIAEVQQPGLHAFAQEGVVDAQWHTTLSDTTYEPHTVPVVVEAIDAGVEAVSGQVNPCKHPNCKGKPPAKDAA